MASKPILERIQAALSPRCRLTDCRTVLADAETELACLDARIAAAERNSTNPSVSNADARLAWEQAQDFRLHKGRLARGIEQLREVIAEKDAAQRSEERLQAYEAVKAEHDILEGEWRDLGPVFERLFDLFDRTIASDARIADINRHLPAGKPRLRSAELDGRGALNDCYFPDAAGLRGEQLTRFTERPWMLRPDVAWSRDQLRAAVNATVNAFSAASARAQAARSPEVVAAKAEAEAARWTRYEVTQRRYNGGRVRIDHRGGIAGIGNETGKEAARLWLDERQVEAAKAAGLLIEPVEEKELAR